ncbi:hypothetical protein [Corynebacterium pyruviciproducens]|uniref:hypothetical protein n=1 Tax=Corynebacterium pyruviciproducens TaxID=598660 RepID=UPI00288907C9|nr:hypothetical protein [Corynebacterium pyruviciproducens]
MQAWIAKIPQRWANEKHPRLYTANPKQAILIIAPSRSDAKYALTLRLGAVEGYHWEELQPARKNLNRLLKAPDCKGISNIITSGGTCIYLN